MADGFNGDLLWNNPFLDMVEEERRNMQQQQPVLGGPGGPRFNFKLPEYWDHAPDMWFALAEFRFETAGIFAERQRFAYVVDALGYKSLRLVNDLLLTLPADRPYSVLKERLLLASQLTAVQMAEKVMKMPELGDRRPSQLLAAMLEFCPPAQQQSPFFRAAFLTRLPAAIRSHLDEMEEGDLKVLAAKADRQWLNCGGAATVAAVAKLDLGGQVEEEPEDPGWVAALKQQGGKQKQQWYHKKKQEGGKKQGTWKRTDGGGGAGGSGGDWSSMTSVCARHARYGENAFSCGNPKQCKFGKQGN